MAVLFAVDGFRPRDSVRVLPLCEASGIEKPPRWLWSYDVLGVIDALEGLWFDYFGGEAIASTSLLSTASVHASLLLERTEPTAPQESRRRYYRYLFARVVDGRVFQAGPDKDIADGHHRIERPAHLDELYSASTSTGW